MSTRSTQSAGIDVLMAHEASTEGTPSRFGQGWPSRRRPAPWFVRFAVTLPSLFATRARTLPQAEMGTRRHEDTNVGAGHKGSDRAAHSGKAAIGDRGCDRRLRRRRWSADRIVTDPEACMFDPGVLACSSGDGPAAITECR